MKLTIRKIKELSELIKLINTSDFENFQKVNLKDIETRKEFENFKTLIKKYYSDSNVFENKILEYNQNVLRFAQHDYSVQNKLDSENELLNSLGLSINLLGEELNYSTVTTNYLDDVFNSIKDMIIVIDKQNSINFVNTACSAILKYNKDELLNTPISKILVEEIDFEMLIRNNSTAFTYFFVSKDKLKIPIQLSVANFVRGDNVEIGTVIIGKDMTAKLKIEEALQRSEMNYRKLYESTTDAVMLFDGKGFFDCNNATLKVFGSNSKAEFNKLYPSVVSLYHQSDGRDSFTLFKKRIDETTKSGKLRFDWVLKRFDTGASFDAEVLLCEMEFDGRQILQVVIRDITERKRAEEALKESEDKFKYIFDNSIIGKSITQLTGEIKVNQAFCDILGYKMKELEKKKWWEITYKDDIELTNNMINTLLKKEKDSVRFTKRYIHKNGSIIWIDLSSSLRRDNQGNPLYFITSLVDITEQKKSEDAIAMHNQSLIKLNQISIDLSKMSIENNLESYIVKKIKEIAGAEVSIFSDYDVTKKATIVKEIELEPGILEKIMHLLGRQIKNMQSPLSDELYKEITQEIIGVRKTLHEASFGSVSRSIGAAIQAMLRVDRFIGLAYIIEGNLYGTSLLAMKKGQPDPQREILENFINMSALALRRKKAEESLKESQQLFQNLTQVSPVGIFRTRADGYTTYVNPKWSELSGLSFEEALGYGWLKAVHPEDRKFLNENWNADVRMQQSSFAEYRFLKSDGSIVWVIGNAVPEIVNNCIQGFIGTITDITERKLIEKTLKESEEKYRQITENISDVVWVTDLKYRNIYISPSVERLIGESCETYSNKSMEEKFTPDSLEKINRLISEELRKEKEGNIEINRSYLIEVEHFLLENKTIWLSMNVSFLRDKNKKINGIQGVIRDISERKKAEEALKNSEKNYRILFNNSPIGIAVSDLEGNILRINPSLLKILGSPSEEETMKMNLLTFKPLIDAGITSLLQKTIESQKPVIGEKKYLTKWGKQLVFLIHNNPIFDNEGKLNSIQLIVQDITEQKKAEENMRESEEIFNCFMEHSPIYVFFKDENLRPIRLSKNYETLLNKPITEILGKSMFDLYPSEYAKIIIEQDTKILNGEKELRIEEFFNDHFYSTIKFPILIEGKPTYIAGYTYDITESKQSEIALRKSEEKYRDLFKYAPMGIYLSNREGKFINVNTRLAEMLGYNSIDELLLLNIGEDIYWNNKEREMLISKYDPIGFVYNLEVEWRKKNNTPIWISLSTHQVKDEHNRFLYFEGFVQDITFRKEAETKIQTIAKQWQETFNAVNDAIWVMGVDGKILRSNKASEKLLKLKESEIINHFCWEVLHHTKEPIKDCPVLILKKTSKREMVVININEKWFETTVDPIFDENDDITGIVHIISDITERKKVEHEIFETEHRYRTLIESFYDMIYLTTYDNKMIYANPSLQLWTGYSIDEFNLPSRKINYVYPDDLDYVETFINDFIGSNNKYSKILENRFITKNGEIHWHSSVISKVEYAGQAVLQFICRDITEKKKFESELIESEEKYRRLHESMTDCFVQTDMTGKIVNVNKSYKEMIGYSTEELYKLKYTDITPTKWLEIENSIVEKQILVRGYSDVYEKEYIKKDGVVFPVEVRTFLLKDSKGNPSGMWAIIRDITERKQMEEAMLNINEQLEQRVKMRTIQLEDAYNEMEAFTYSVSHDLRAPIRAIDGFSKMVLQDYSDIDPEAVRLLNIICQSSRNMGKLIDDLLVLSRVGRANIDVLSLKMKDIVKSVFTQIKRENAKFKSEIKILDLFDVPADKTLITQVWTNLISNAVKFSSQTDHPEIEIGSYKEGKEVVYYVKDNGVGFDMTYIDKLFGVFQRLHTTDEFEGTGIGLAIVRKAIIRQGGRVWAESVEGKGASFFFTLPMEK